MQMICIRQISNKLVPVPGTKEKTLIPLSQGFRKKEIFKNNL